MTTVITSDDIFPKIVSGRVTITSAVTGDAQFFNIPLNTDHVRVFNMFFSIDEDEYIFPVASFQVASDPATWVERTHGQQVQAIGVYPDSIDPDSGDILTTYTFSLFINNTDSVEHDIHIYYFIYGEEAIR